MRRIRPAAALLPVVLFASSCSDSGTPPEPNRPPTLGALSMQLDEDGEAVLDVLAAAADPNGDSLVADLLTAPAHGQASPVIGGVRYVPDADFHGTDAFDVAVRDPRGLNASGTVAVTVRPINDAPVARQDQAGVYEEETTPLDVLANDTDVDGDSLALTAAFDGAHGTAAVAGDLLAYTSIGEYAGPDTVRYVVSDGILTDTGRVAIVVIAVNDPPHAVDDTASAPEDTAGIQLDLLANDTDPEGDALTIQYTGQPGHGTVSGDQAIVTYVPHPDYFGTDVFTYVIADAYGNTASAAVTVTVIPVPDPPVAVDDSAAAVEGDTVTIDVLANDSDADGDSLVLDAVMPPAHGTAAIDAGRVRYTPASHFEGTDVFDYVVTDGTGRADTASVRVTVTTVNTAPTAVDDTATVAEDGSVVIDVLANDTDPDGDPLTTTAHSSPTHGDVFNGGSSWSYQPDPNYNGADSFRYVVRDDGGLADTATVRITVTPVNDPPTPVRDSATVPEDSTVLIDVLANDIDVDGDSLMPGSTIYFPDGIIPPAHGTAAWENGRVRYTPYPSFNGVDSLTYWVTDGEATLGGTVHITVPGTNDPPVAADDAAATVQNTAVEVYVLANDGDPDNDLIVDGTIRTLTLPTVPGASITVKDGGPGVGAYALYNPAPNYLGTDSWLYEVSDGLAADTARVTVAVQAASPDPAPTGTATGGTGKR